MRASHLNQLKPTPRAIIEAKNGEVVTITADAIREIQSAPEAFEGGLRRADIHRWRVVP